CLGSSALVPRLLLLYPPAPLAIFGRLRRAPENRGAQVKPRRASSAATHVAPGPRVKNQSAEVSHSLRRIENQRPPTMGSTQGHQGNRQPSLIRLLAHRIPLWVIATSATGLHLCGVGFTRAIATIGLQYSR